ncbi:M14 family metallopeptidase [Metabacillus flavus]|uniref:M14 family metallopeptidase n=1 Tax=Metabacillus flavus TaxID=2823519 RepID=UPI00201684AF|nr:M14 family metallocarboxypeptidase [Metabacillus flavus]
MKIRLKESVEINALAAYFEIPAILIEQSNQTLTDPIPSEAIVNIPGYEWGLTGLSIPSAFEPEDAMEGCDKAVKVSERIVFRQKSYTSACFYRDIEKMVLKYPFIRTHIIGKSIRNQPIIEITMGTGKRNVHMNASFHANEWITSAVLMDWLEQYANDLVHGKARFGHSSLQLYTHTSLSVVPMVNPDGVDLVLEGLPDDSDLKKTVLQINHQSLDFSQWKANIRGVDLNNQFPAYWEIEKERKLPKTPAPRDYPGDCPLSEPEARAMARLSEEKGFDRLLCFHTQGEEIYWGYLNREPEEAALIVKEFSILSGYTEVRNIDSHAGYRDWFIHEWGRSGYTIELGLGVNPLPLVQYESIRKKGEGIFWAALYM